MISQLLSRPRVRMLPVMAHRSLAEERTPLTHVFTEPSYYRPSLKRPIELKQREPAQEGFNLKLSSPNQRQVYLAHLRELLADKRCVVSIWDMGARAKDKFNLRVKAMEAGVTVVVPKSFAARQILLNSKHAALAGACWGRMVLCMSKDPASAAKLALEYCANMQRLKLMAGSVDGEVFDADQLKMFLNLPPLEEVQPQLLGPLATAIRGVVHTVGLPISATSKAVSTPLTALARTLNVVKLAKEKENEPAGEAKSEGAAACA